MIWTRRIRLHVEAVVFSGLLTRHDLTQLSLI